jgi:hypothetical protein
MGTSRPFAPFVGQRGMISSSIPWLLSELSGAQQACASDEFPSASIWLSLAGTLQQSDIFIIPSFLKIRFIA